MLNWLVSRLKPIEDAPGHPLGSEADIAAWLAELPSVNPQRVLLAVDEWLEDPEHLAKQLDASQMARAVGRLDEYAQPAAGQCWLQVLQEAQKEQRGALPTRPLENFYEHSYASNLLVLRQLIDDSNLNQERRLLAKFAARAMHAWVRLKKLSYMTYRAPAEHWWRQAHELNRLARDLALSHIEQNLYRESPVHTSVWKEYMTGLLLDTLPVSNLTANEIEAAERLSVWIEPRCQYLEMQTGLSLFQIDPDGERGPERCRDGQPVVPGWRYLGPGAGYQQLVQLGSSLQSTRTVPAWLETSGLSQEQLQGLLQTMIVHWSPNPPTRGQPRHARTGRIRVVHGLGMVRRMIAASEFARSGRNLDYEGYIKSLRLRHSEDDAIVDDVLPQPKTPLEVLQLLESAGDRQMMDQWEIIDESLHGMGVRCHTRRPWHTIGALCAYRQEDELSWHVAVVRRLGSSHGTPNAGLVTFEGTPLCSQVRLVDSSRTDDPWQGQIQERVNRGWRDAILLSSQAHLLLVPEGTFEAQRGIEISLAGRFYPARMATLQGEGSDYELITYTAAAVETGGK